MSNLPSAASAEDLAPFSQNAKFYIGTAVGRTSSKWLIHIDGTATDERITMRAAYGLTFSLNARVIVIEISGTYMALARVGA